LTKAFVVVAALLSVALSGLVIAYAANMDKVRQALSDESAKRVAAEASLGAQATGLNAEKVRLSADIQQLQNDLTNLRGQITSLQQESAKLQVERDRALGEKLSTEGKISELSKLAQTQAELLQNHNTEVGKLRSSELAYKQRSLEMEDRISDLETQRDVLEQNYRALQEELAQIKRNGSGTPLVGLAGAAPANDRPFVYNGPLIMGRIETVQRDTATGKTMAKLSVGTNDRIAKNMELKIIRNNDFVAKVIVTDTDLSYSVGVIDTLNRNVEVQAGDIVVSRIQ
jgi:septal ring factor EnvC (AmiA/AmiB activator)